MRRGSWYLQTLHETFTLRLEENCELLSKMWPEMGRMGSGVERKRQSKMAYPPFYPHSPLALPSGLGPLGQWQRGTVHTPIGGVEWAGGTVPFSLLFEMSSE